MNRMSKRHAPVMWSCVGVLVVVSSLGCSEDEAGMSGATSGMGLNGVLAGSAPSGGTSGTLGTTTSSPADDTIDAQVSLSSPQPAGGGAPDSNCTAGGPGPEPDSNGGAGGPEVDLPEGAMPEGAEKLEGIDFFHRIVGKWTGTVSETPLGYDFPMTVDFAPFGEGMIFGQFEVIAGALTVVWGFNIETYAGTDVLAYRNGGYLGGFPRDSRTKLVEHDASRSYYRFCAVKESGLPVNGCEYIEASYTFTEPDTMVFEVTTRGGEPHVHWEAHRTEVHELPQPFPGTIASQGDGSAPWPEAAGLD